MNQLITVIILTNIAFGDLLTRIEFGGISLNALLGIFTLSLYIIYFTLRKNLTRLPKFPKVILLSMVVISVLQSMRSVAFGLGDINDVIQENLALSLFVLTAYFIYSLNRETQKRIYELNRVLVYSFSILVSLIIIITKQYNYEFAGIQLIGPRTIAPLLGAAVIFLLFDKTIDRAIGYSMIGVILFSLAFSESRTVVVVYLLCSYLAYIFSKNSLNIFSNLGKVFASVAIILISVAVWNSPVGLRIQPLVMDFASVISNPLGPEAADLTSGRSVAWSQIWPKIIDSPLWGYGAGTASPFIESIITNERFKYPHNEYLRTTFEYGLIYTGALIVVFLYSIFSKVPTDNNTEVNPVPLKALIAACMFSMFTENTLLYTFVTMQIAIAIGLIISQARIREDGANYD